MSQSDEGTSSEIVDPILERREGEPSEITKFWRDARNGPLRFNNQRKHWDGKPKKEKLPF